MKNRCFPLGIKTEQANIIFYTDGSGNCEHDKKTSEYGNYSVYLLNSKEKWREIENKITGNQAEIKGVILALEIAIERKYRNVEIKTDCKYVICWFLGRDKSLKTNVEKIKKNFFRTKHDKIRVLINTLVELAHQIPNLSMNKIPRDDNLAHNLRTKDDKIRDKNYRKNYRERNPRKMKTIDKRELDLLLKIKKPFRDFEHYEQKEKDAKPIKLTKDNVRRRIEEQISLDYKNNEISLEEFKIKMDQIDDYLDKFLVDFEMKVFEVLE